MSPGNPFRRRLMRLGKIRASAICKSHPWAVSLTLTVLAGLLPRWVVFREAAHWRVI